MGAKKILHYLAHPKSAILPLLIKYFKWLPDRIYLKIMFRQKMGRRLVLNPPVLFNDKLQWLKLYNRRPEYSRMVDKQAVKEHVTSIIGAEYVIPTLGVWDNVDDIEWDKLPSRFVLKTTHGGGGRGVIVCRDFSHFDIDAAKKELRWAMNLDIYKEYREWPYKNVRPRIIAEQYMQDGDSDVLSDYKFSCFNGKVHDVMVCLDRGSDDIKFYFFDRAWELLRINRRGIEAPEGFTIPKPPCMDEMFALASRLSEGLPYARVDMYSINGHVYFGEITFFPKSGFGCNFLLETEQLYGKMLVLPPKTKA